MINPFLSDGEAASPNSAVAVELTAARFFDANSYFTRDEWMDYGKRLRPREISDLRKLLSLMSAGFTMDGNTEIRKDKGKREYLYDHFIQSKARPGVKIILEGGMFQFLQDYQQGEITINFSLDDLIAEAKKQL